jgi:hypothetical protein
VFLTSPDRFPKRIPDLLHPVSFSFFSPGQPKLPLAVPFFRDRDTILASGFTITTGTAGGASPTPQKRRDRLPGACFLPFPTQTNYCAKILPDRVFWHFPKATIPK